MPTNEERREVAAKLRKADDACEFLYALGLKCDIDCEDCSSHVFTRKVCGVLADLIEPEPERIVPVANITFTAEQQDEIYRRVMEEFAINGCPKCGARMEEMRDAD